MGTRSRYPLSLTPTNEWLLSSVSTLMNQALYITALCFVHILVVIGCFYYFYLEVYLFSFIHEASTDLSQRCILYLICCLSIG